MLSRILVANRGEIALRIIRACKELGIETVAVFSKEDRHSLPVIFADEAICIGPREPAESYLNVPRIISAAELAGAEAIHPGYGFLAESEYFAEACRSSGLEFIGPGHQVIEKLGNKIEARNTLRQAGIPVVAGSEGVLQDKKQAEQTASRIGYPVVLKAVAGGGGRGMRMVRRHRELASLYELARQEAKMAFGNPDLYMERYMSKVRHIEFQILADNFNHVLHFGERNCSIQRRYQKLMEESPAGFIDEELRQRMGQVAVKVARELNYTGAGTVEFLVNEDGSFYFIEMNTRLQVEHPVTEMVTGRDLVKAQILIAGNEPLSYSQEDIEIRGAAIECRITAEDPDRNFTPSPGTVAAFHVPGGPGVRVDTHVYTDYAIPACYDSLIAKLITWGLDRNEAIARMRRALDEFVIEGVRTTIPLHRRIMDHDTFLRATFCTDFLEQEFKV